MTRTRKLLLGAAFGGVLFVGYATFIKTETPGERFRKAMALREKHCATDRMQAGDTSCNILKLQRPDPMATPEGRHAHSIKVPGLTLQNVYRKGMTSREYFRALCETQAGEFIFKTVTGVDGIVQMRPRQVATDDMLMHLYALEDPFGAVTEGDAKATKQYLVTPASYKYMERTSQDKGGRETIIRTIGFGPDSKTNGYERLDEHDATINKAKYGFTWRGLEVPNGREHGIAGSELIVVEVATEEVLAVRRGFIRTGSARGSFTGIWWLAGQVCPQGRGRPEYYTFDFLTRVLIPRRSITEGQDGK